MGGSGSAGSGANATGSSLHLAFLTDALEADRDRLVAAGATIDGDPVHNPQGDVLQFLRDPWGLAFQIVARARPLLDE